MKRILAPALALSLSAASADEPAPTAGGGRSSLVFACRAENDLFRALADAGESFPRYGALGEAIEKAPEGAGVLVLADGYPAAATAFDASLREAARRKRLRLYIEFPSWLPDMELGGPRGIDWERAVVASDAFAPALSKMRILSINGCRFLPAPARSAQLVLARVAGYDTAVFGLPGETWPVLFEHPGGDLLVATTKLSQFVTARCAPADAWKEVWRMVLGWLDRAHAPPALKWTNPVRTSFGRDEPLPAAARIEAIRLGVEWYERSGLLLGGSDGAPGDGRKGILEGYGSIIAADGTQPIRRLVRADCNCESAMALAARGLIDRGGRSRTIATNLLDFVYFESDLQKGPRGDPASPSYGLLGWFNAPDGLGTYYGDDNAKAVLATMTAAAALGTDRWDEPMLRSILGNFRTAGRLGFRGSNCLETDLRRLGWRHHLGRRLINPWPHYESWLWASYLWLYDKTRFEPLLSRPRRAIELTMSRYPDRWGWTNGSMQIERARMLLPLAWLVRVEDRPEHRVWLQRIAGDLLAHQDSSGAIQERIASALKSNEEYGTGETSLLQENGDPVSDMLYTSNFALTGLNEAAAATLDEALGRAAGRLADFLVRIQVRSSAHPELDGGWFRAFDSRRWEHWGSNGDSGWGAWCMETGWTHGWIVAGLAMRQVRRNLWELTSGSRIALHFEAALKEMLPEGSLEAPAAPAKLRHAALDRPVELSADADPRYPGSGPPGLTDGELGGDDYRAPEWLGLFGRDLDATIDLGSAVPLRKLEARFLQDVGMGIFLPREVVFSVSEDGRAFREVATVKHEVSPREPGPLAKVLATGPLGATARYVKVHAASIGRMPEWHPARGAPAWLFVDEVAVHPVEGKP